MPVFAGLPITLPLRVRLLKPASLDWSLNYNGMEFELSWQWETRRPWLSWALAESQSYELVQDGRRRRWKMSESSLQFTRRRAFDNRTCSRVWSQMSER